MRSGLVIAGTIALVASVAVADRLPRTLSFVNETAERVVPNQAEGQSNEKEVEFGDLDRDGDLDVVVAVGSSNFGERKNKIYFNEDGVFVEKSGKPLIPEFALEDVSRNAFIRDYNKDGWPDIYIVNDSNLQGFAGEHKIYLAEHEGGKLTGYSEEGATRIPNGGDLGASCGGVSADFDGDGDFDVYAGNYPGPSQDDGLYLDAAYNFVDLTQEMIPEDTDYTVDVALADMNGDGKMDLLVSNDRDPSYIYYNDLGKDSTGPGDFKSADSAYFVGLAFAHENAMEPADFDNDGDNDIYWTNFVGSHGDRIFENTGNNELNQALFDARDVLPAFVKTNQTRKATVADFNADGRIDVFVAMQQGDSRPVVLRKTSTGPGDFSFVDWSPAPALPTDGTLRGWHGAAFDTGGDGDVDILIGAFAKDRLLENIRANEVDEDDLGPMPALWNGEPVAVQGRGETDEVDEYVVGDVANGFLSVVLNGPGDYSLEIVDALDVIIASSDRGGLDVEEAVQVDTAAGAHTIRVTILQGGLATCDYGADFNADCEVDFDDMLGVLSNWGCTDCRWDLDGDGAGFSDLLTVLDEWGPVTPRSDYLLEVLGRSEQRPRMRRIGSLLTVLAALAGCGEDAATAPRTLPAELAPAVALIERGRFDAARAAADAYLAEHPGDAHGLFVKGLSFHRARDYAQAEPLLVRALAVDPGYDAVQHFLGYCRFYLGDLPAARRAFEAHLRAEPDESDSHFGLGVVALEEGQFAEARARIDHAVELIAALETADPARYRSRRGDLAKCHARLGDIALARGDADEARDQLRRSIAIDPNLYGAYYLLSRVERRLGNEAEADRLLALFEQMAAARHRRTPPGDGS